MAKRTCTIEGCDRKHYGKGLCNMHRLRLKRTGDPLAKRTPWFSRERFSVEERFWGKVNKNGPIPENRPDLGPCWLWTARLNDKGYGQWSATEQLHFRAHRWAWEQEHGAVPEGLELDHLCRVRPCVRPSHLDAVTHAENMRRGEPFKGDKGTHCRNGHEYAVVGVYRRPDNGTRQCRACQEIRSKRRYG